MSLVLADEVCAARSCCSIRQTRRPRPAASRAMPAPLMPPPTTSRSKSADASVVATNPAAQLLGPSGVHLAGEPFLLRGTRRPGRPPRHRRAARGFNQCLETLQRIALVAFLRAMVPGDDDDLVAVCQAPPGQLAQALLRCFVQRAGRDAEPQLRGRRNLVDVLPAGTGGADEGDVDGIAETRRHGPPPRSCTMRTSCCATGMVMPASRNARQMARFTSERTLLTPSCGSEIQNRSSRSIPESPKCISRDTGAGSRSTRGLQLAAATSTCRAFSGSSW